MGALHLKYKSGCVSYLSRIPKSPDSFFILCVSLAVILMKNSDIKPLPELNIYILK